MNLHVLPSSFLSSSVQHRSTNALSNCSIFNTICQCRTAFGRRCLRQWIAAPLCDPSEIEKRHDALKWLMNSTAASFIDSAAEILKKIPDLERIFQRSR
jgi:DNA mismatch repair ATPase MutS